MIRLLFTLLLFGLVYGIDSQTTEGVTLRETTVTWETYRYEVDDNYSFVRDAWDLSQTMQHTFSAWEIENEYLKLTVVPEFGGRVLSMIYKPTGHEELYQNPIGSPYGIGEGNFYHDWLMVWGGIFPTFPEPEHGKTWLMPWDFEIVTETPEEVTVAMSLSDTTENPDRPKRFSVGVTGVEVTFYVTLRAGRAVLETREVIVNPNKRSHEFEYWTNTGFAPGSIPGETRTTAAAEIIAPIDRIRMPPWWPDTLCQEDELQGRDVYTFTNLRRFENWADMGIAYAFPNLGDTNFWGVINHDNGEGIFRIADNTITPGLKIWTFGYESVDVDPAADGLDFRRPFIEMWAGISTEFWERERLGGGDEIVIDAIYSPSVGLDNVTHASDEFLVNLMAEDGTAHLQIHAMTPGQEIRARLLLDGEALADTLITPDPATGATISASLPGDGALTFVLETPDGDILFQG